MIISEKYRYVYIGIPRTGSKSMNHWLCSYYDGQNYGGHHDYNVPEEARDYLVFTVVRNPYDRRTSGHFAVTWGGAKPQEGETPFQVHPDYSGCRNSKESCERLRSHLGKRAAKEQRDMPVQSAVPLADRIREAVQVNDGDHAGINQKRFVDRAKVKQVLYFEHLPASLTELPFVNPRDIPLFPHHPERGICPEGDFFDFFRNTDEEQVVWAHAAEDFEAFGYRRYECGLPENTPPSLRIE